MKNVVSFLFAIISFPAFSQNNPVVVELFTSQGCSSCPAADKNLSELIEAAEKKGQLVYGLSYHVDYWNYIGWKDPYSNPAYTARQRQYSSSLNSEGIYTPQMIVNGKVEFVGSDKKAAEAAIAAALAKKMEYQISVNSVERKDGKISVAYSLSSLSDPISIYFALVERKVENSVTKGENSGRKLAHRNVVRSLTSAAAKKDGIMQIPLPQGLSECSIIIFIQDDQWHIKGATATVIQ